MDDFSKVMEQVVLDRLAGKGRGPLFGVGVLEKSLIVLSMAFIVMAFGLFVVGAYVGLMDRFPPDIALALTGGFSLVPAFLMAVFAWGIVYARRCRLKEIRREIETVLSRSLSSLDEEWGETVRKNPKSSIALASLAGFRVGEKFL